jgi:adenylate cyclase
VYRLNAATQANEVERAQFNLAAVDALNQSASGIDTVLGLHLRAAVERWILAEGDPLTGTLRLAVGFVDLVGYTPRSLHATPDEIRGMVEELEATAYEVAADHQGRVVKLIGDAVMYVSTTPSHACAIALAFVEAFRSHAGDITPRGGVAMGDVVAWQGDYYGPVVNLSARIAELAVPNEVLVAAPVPTETAPVSGITFVPAGRRLLKGFDEPVELWAAQRA